MAYGEEETVDGNIDLLFVGLTLALYEMGALYTVLSEEANGVVLEQDLDVLALFDTLLHHL